MPTATTAPYDHDATDPDAPDGVRRPLHRQGCGTCSCTGRVTHPRTRRLVTCPACQGAGSR